MQSLQMREFPLIFPPYFAIVELCSQPAFRLICYWLFVISQNSESIVPLGGPGAEGEAHRIRRAVLATAAGRVGCDCPITCTSSVQPLTLVTSFNASD